MALRSLTLLALLCGTAVAADAQDPSRARYADACDDGDLSACNTLGLLYEAADGDVEAHSEAADLYERACEGGFLRACTNLGMALERGTGVGRNVQRAAELYAGACAGGETLACARLRSLEAAGRVAPSSGPAATSGRVADAVSSVALGQAIVAIPGLGVQAITDARGGFTLPELPPGQYTLRAERVGYETVERELTVPGTPDLLILLPEAAVGDPSAPGRVVGRVIEDGGSQALSDVEVVVEGQEGARTLSNQQGRFTIRDVDPGLQELRFERLGYAERTATLIVHPGRTVEVAATMATEPIELDPIQVTVRSSFLEENGFYERVDRGWGSHFTTQDLDRLNPVAVADVIRGRVPGVRITSDPQDASREFAVSRRSTSVSQGPCILPVYVDGVRQPEADLNQYPPEWLEAMEVYHGVGTPIRYVGGPNECGVVLIWTRH